MAPDAWHDVLNSAMYWNSKQAINDPAALICLLNRFTVPAAINFSRLVAGNRIIRRRRHPLSFVLRPNPPAMNQRPMSVRRSVNRSQRVSIAAIARRWIAGCSPAGVLPTVHYLVSAGLLRQIAANQDEVIPPASRLAPMNRALPDLQPAPDYFVKVLEFSRNDDFASNILTIPNLKKWSRNVVGLVEFQLQVGNPTRLPCHYISSQQVRIGRGWKPFVRKWTLSGGDIIEFFLEEDGEIPRYRLAINRDWLSICP